MAAETKCLTNGAIYNTEVTSQKVSVSVELPFKLEISEEEAQPEPATDSEAGTEISEEEAQPEPATDSDTDAEVSEETDKNQPPE